MTTDQQTPAIAASTPRCEELLREIVSIRSVVGEDTTAHLWMSERLSELGMTVEHYAVEGRRTPLVLGILEGQVSTPGVLFDAHYDTVGAVPGDWSRDPWRAHVEDGVLYGRGAVDSKGPLVAILIRASCWLLGGWSQQLTGNEMVAVRMVDPEDPRYLVSMSSSGLTTEQEAAVNRAPATEGAAGRAFKEDRVILI